MDWFLTALGLVDLGEFVPRWMSIITDVALKSLVILAVAWVVTVAMRSASAAARHAVWAMALGSILALPLLSALMPRWEMRIFPAPVAERVQPASPAPASVGRADVVPAQVAVPAVPSVDPVTAVPPLHPQPATSVAIPSVEPPSEPGLRGDVMGLIGEGFQRVRAASAGSNLLPLFLTWLAGALIVLGMLVTGLVRTAFMASAAPPITDAAWRRLKGECCRRLGLTRPVQLVRGQVRSMPSTWGVFRPIVQLPTVSDDWSPDRKRDVLFHELAHVKRFDFLTQVIARYACAILWFNPLMWLVARQLRIEAERACDDEVLLAGSKPSTYARHLLEIARSARRFTVVQFSSVAMAQRSQLAGRVSAILDDGRNRRPMSRTVTRLICCAVVVLVLPLSSVVAVRAEPSVQNPVAPVVMPVIFTPQAPARQWASAPQCNENSGSARGVNENAHDDRQSTRWWDGDCEGEVRIRDTVQFTPDYRDIQSVSNGGSFSIEINAKGDTRKVEVRPNGTGLARRWFVDGSERSFGADAAEWLPRALQDFFRHSTFDIDGRVTFVLAQEGVSGLLRQAEAAHGSYLVRRLYAAAIETGDLTPDQIAEILDRATRDVTSDFEMASLLMAIPANDLRDATVRKAYVQASSTIESDFEKARVLTAFLQQENLGPDVIRQLLASVQDIESDFELARVLTTIGPRYLDDPLARDLYLEATLSIESDFELQRLLATMMDVDDLSEDNLRLLLESARRIESDFESARLLTAVAEKFTIDDVLRQLFFQSVNDIGSDFERQRVLTALLDRPNLTHDVVSDAIRSAANIGSDFEKANVLTKIADRYRADESLRSQLEEAAETVSSRHEHGRVMAALRGR